MSHEPIHERIAEALPPEPPERLRSAALGAAQRSWGTGRDLWSRLWESRPVRLAWAAAVLALLAGHALLPGARPGGADAGVAPTLADRGGPELSDAVGPIPLRITPLVWLGEGFSRSSIARPTESTHLNSESS